MKPNAVARLDIHHAHRWDVTPGEAIGIQQRLRSYVVLEDRLPERVGTVAGVDVGFQAGGRLTRAAVAVLAFPSLKRVERAVAEVETRFPYVPGLLSFREILAVLEALKRLPKLPDLLLCDGQGIAHPRRFGIASHLGVLLDHPTIGVAKSRLVGSHGPVPEGKGEWVPLRDGDEIIGAVLRTRKGVKPIYVSPGHRLCLETAVSWVMACVTRYKLPETTRQAHRLASDE